MSDRILRKQLALLAKSLDGAKAADSRDQPKAKREPQRLKRQRVRSTDAEPSADQVKKRNLAFFRDTMKQPAPKD